MHLYYVTNARMPNEKAHGIQIAKMCEAFLEEGVAVTLVIPTRRTKNQVADFCNLRVAVPTVRLYTPDFFNWGQAGFFISSLWFFIRAQFFLREKEGLVYSVDMDSFSFAFLPLRTKACFVEIHSAKPVNIFSRYFFRHASGVIATNGEIAKTVSESFRVNEENLITEPNGVDINSRTTVSRTDARTRLGLPLNHQIVVYVGQFYEWKGLGIIAEAARGIPEVEFRIVGGSTEAYKRVTGITDIPNNVYCEGLKPPADIPLWLAAADVLLVLGTRASESSYRFTAPMKVFEYFLAKRSVVASKTPAIQSLVGEHEVFWYEPDHVEDLSSSIQEALVASDPSKIEGAYERAVAHSWNARAARIRAFMQNRI